MKELKPIASHDRQYIDVRPEVGSVGDPKHYRASVITEKDGCISRVGVSATTAEEARRLLQERIEDGRIQCGKPCAICDRITSGEKTEGGHFICDGCTDAFEDKMSDYDTRGWSEFDRLCGRCGDVDSVIGDESLCSSCYFKENEQEVVGEMKAARQREKDALTRELQAQAEVHFQELDEKTDFAVNQMIGSLCAGVLIAFLAAGFFASLAKHSEFHLGTAGMDVERVR